MTLSRHDKDFLPTDDESDSTTDDDTESLFDESDDNTGDTDDTEILSNESGSDTDDEACLSDDEGPHPPEYYLAEAASLDVKRLRQRRYSLKTQERLDWVKDHWYE
jgi:hypothetical protein